MNIQYKEEMVLEKRFQKNKVDYRADVFYIVSKDGCNVLLQKRSATKKLWPNLWDITAGGHVDASELGYLAVIREAKEELGLDISKEQLEYIGSCVSNTKKGSIIDNHFNEFYVAYEDVDVNTIKLQTEEVQEVKWFNKEELIKVIKNKNDFLTDKKGCWNYLLKYFEMIDRFNDKLNF